MGKLSAHVIGKKESYVCCNTVGIWQGGPKVPAIPIYLGLKDFPGHKAFHVKQNGHVRVMSFHDALQRCGTGISKLWQRLAG